MDDNYLKSLVFVETNSIVLPSQFGESILDCALKLKLPLDHSCGGNGSCGTCRVFIDFEKELPPRNEIEADFVEGRGFSYNERLACQTSPQVGMKVRFPKPQFNQGGFTLIEIMVSMLIVGLLLLGVAQIQAVLKSEAQTVEQKMEFQDIRLRILSLLNSKGECQGAFLNNGVPIQYQGSSVNITAIVFREEILATTIQAPTQNNIVSEIKLSPIVGQVSANTGSSIFKAELIIKGENIRNVEHSTSYKFYFQTNANREIISCTQSANLMEEYARSCDSRSFSHTKSIVDSGGNNLRVYKYGELSDSKIDDGGSGGFGDGAEFYCVVKDGEYLGAITVCLTEEACVWR